MTDQNPMHDGSIGACCYDCRRAYGTFPDLILPKSVWFIIGPTGDEGGILCPSCICERMDRHGMCSVPYYWGSGPFASRDSENEQNIFDWNQS